MPRIDDHAVAVSLQPVTRRAENFVATFPAFQQFLGDGKRETVRILGYKQSVRFDQRAARHGVFDQRALRAAIGEEIRRRQRAILGLQRHVLLQAAPGEQQSAGYAAQRLHQ